MENLSITKSLLMNDEANGERQSSRLSFVDKSNYEEW